MDCEIGYSRYDDFELSPICISETVMLAIRASIFALDLTVVISSIIYMIKFKESTIQLFKPKEWKNVHVAHVMVLLILIYGKKT